MQNQEEILSLLRPEAQEPGRRLLERLREAGIHVTLNLLANAIWSLLAWADPNQLGRLLRALFGR